MSDYYMVNPWYYILAVIPHSILGGNCVFSVAALCFISDVTDSKTRPYRQVKYPFLQKRNLIFNILILE